MTKSWRRALFIFIALTFMSMKSWAGTDWVYDNPTGSNPDLINYDDWDRGNVTVEADDADTHYEVGYVGEGTGNDLTITSDGLGNASLLFGNRVDSVDDQLSDPPKPPHRINFYGDATLRGYAVIDNPTPNDIGRATLTVSSGNILSFSGLTLLEEYSTLSVTGTDTAFLTEYLQIHGRDAVVSVTDGATMRVFDQAVINEGKLEVTSGHIDFWQGLRVIGYTDPDVHSVLELKGGATIDLSEDPETREKNGKGVFLEAGGQLLVTDGLNQITDNDDGKSYLYNESGYFLVDSTAELYANNVYLDSNHAEYGSGYGSEILGILSAEAVTLGGDGTTLVSGIMYSYGDLTIWENARVDVEGQVAAEGVLQVLGGEVNITTGGALRGDDIRIGGGTVTIDGTIQRMGTESELAVSGGRVTVASGGVIDVDSLRVNGAGAILNIASGGIVKAGTDLRASNGVINLQAGSIIGESAGLGELRTSGDGVINVNTNLTTRVLALGGGNLNLRDGTVTVLEDADPDFEIVASGNLNLMGGNLSVNNALRFTGGGIYGNSPDSVLNMNNNSFALGMNGTIDASEGNIFMENAADFTMEGYYNAGYVNGAVTMLEVTGMEANGGTLSIMSAENKIQMTRDLQLIVNTRDLNDGLLILKTDAIDYTGATSFIWDDDFFGTYTYTVKQDLDTLEYGLYVTDSVARSREEQKEIIISGWRKHPEVLDDGISRVLNDSMIDAIIDGTAIRIGREPGYEDLSGSGQFNAGVLSTLRSPQTSSYDALMLYNGSGLSMVNNAILNNNQQTMKRLGLRNGFIRREMDEVTVMLNPDCDFEVEYPDFEPGNRLWATANHTTDTSGHHVGFSGYKYRGKGILIGYDRLFGRLAIGGAFSYMAGDFTDSAALGSNSDIDIYGGFLYGNYSADNGLFLSGAVGYTYADTQLRDYRILDGNTGWNTADFGGHSYMASVTLGMDMQVTDALSISPSVGFSHVDAHQSSHSQYFTPDSLTGGANTLNAGTIKGHSTQIPLDLALRYDWYLEDESHFSITGNIGYAYELNNKGAGGKVTYGGLQNVVGPVRIANRELGRHILNLGISGKYLYKQYEFGFGYDYTGKQQYNSHTFLLNAGIVF